MMGKEGLSKKGVIDFLFICLFAIFLIIMFNFVNAQITSVFNGGGINSTNYTLINGLPVNEDVAHVYNITVNHTLGYGFKVVNVSVWFLGNNFTLNPYLGNPINAAANNMTIGVNGITDQFTFVQVVNSSPDYILWNRTNATTYVFNENTSRAVNVSWFFFNATADTPGNYNLSVRAGYLLTNGSLGNITYYEHNVTVHINDTTNPFADRASFSEVNGLNRTPTTNSVGNYSGNLLLNISLSDNGGAIRSVFFNVSYNENLSTNGSHWWYPATNHSTSPDWWFYSLDTHDLPDGFYNVSVIVNDSNGNTNTTAHINITIDNTGPSGDITCSPVDGYVGGIITCSCTSADSLSGVSSTTYTASPSTTNAGVGLTQTCTIVDLAGNSYVATSNKYNVWGSPEGESSGTSSSTTTFTYSKTISQTYDDFSQIQSIETSGFSGGGLGAKERVTFTLANEQHYVGVRTITSSSATIEIASTPVQVDLDIGEEIKRDLDDDGFYNVYVKLNGITNGKADLTINYINEEIPEGEGETTTTGEQLPPEGEEQPTTEGTSVWIWVVAGVIILIIVLGGIIIKKKK